MPLEGEPKPREIIIQADDGAFHRLTEDVLAKTRMSDDEVEKLLRAEASASQPPAAAAAPQAKPFSAPFFAPAAAHLPTGFARVAPTFFARVDEKDLFCDSRKYWFERYVAHQLERL